MEKEFRKEPLNDKKVISSKVGTVGYDFCDETIEIFYGCMKSFMENPVKAKTMENWKMFVKTYM